MTGVITEPVEHQDKPSPEYIQLLRAIGASEGTIRRALGETKPRRRWLRWLR